LSIGAVALLGFPGICRAVIAAHGFKVSFLRAVGLLFVPMQAKYLPGRVWTVLGGLWMYGRAGIPKGVAITCMGWSVLVNLSSATVVAAALGAGQVTRFASPWVLALLGIVILASFAFPSVPLAIANAILGALRQHRSAASLSRWLLLRLFVANSVVWLAYGAGFFCLVRSVQRVPIAAAPQLIALFALAQVISFVAVFAPAGIGVREGVLLVGLSPIVGGGNAIVATGLCRIWQTALELLMAAVGWRALTVGAAAFSAAGVPEPETSALTGPCEPDASVATDKEHCPRSSAGLEDNGVP
jgi:hypothetical protein